MADTFKFGKTTPEDIKAFADAKWAVLQVFSRSDWLDIAAGDQGRERNDSFQPWVIPNNDLKKDHMKGNDGWNAYHDADGIKGYSKLFPYCPISCYKLEGIVPGSPKACADYMMNLDLTSLKRQDPDVAAIEKLETGPNYQIMKQTNNLTWPIWARQTIFVMYRREEADGSVWVYSWSVKSDKSSVDIKNYVETNLHLGAWAFAPLPDGKTKMTRIIHVDPCGNIPAFAVEANVGNLPRCIQDVRAHAK